MTFNPYWCRHVPDEPCFYCLPDELAGNAGKVVVVNGSATGYELVDSTDGTVTSVGVSGSDGLEVDSGSPVTSAGTIALGVNASALRSHINVANGADVTNATSVDAAGATMNTDVSLVGNGYFLDEDNMASNSDTQVPSQQSVKAYVDANVGGANSTAIVTTSQTTTSTTYVDLTTVGPSITFTVPASGKVMLSFGAHIANSNDAAVSYLALQMSGANTHTATNDSVYTILYQASGNGFGNAARSFIATGLTPGSTTFILKYQATTATTATFRQRYLSVEAKS